MSSKGSYSPPSSVGHASGSNTSHLWPSPQTSGTTSSCGSSVTIQPQISVNFYPTVPSKTSRYDKVDSVSIATQSKLPKGRHRDKGKGRTLHEVVYNTRALPDGWFEYDHLDGKPYFRHTERKIVTEIDVADPYLLSWVSTMYDHLSQKQRNTADPIDLGGNYELYIALDLSKNALYYYYVDHDTKDIFWLDDVDLEAYGLTIESVPSDVHLDLFMMLNYYRHLENFPRHNELPPDAALFLHGVLAYTCVDHMTTRESATTPWTAEQAKGFLDILESLEDRHKKEKGNVVYDESYRTWFVARLLSIILHSRAIHRHGRMDARIDRLLDVRTTHASIFQWVFGSFLFYAHMTYIERLENVWAGGIVSFTGWQTLLKSLLAEWSDSNLLATVILSANMAFLALNDVTMICLVFSVMSTFLAIGSIAIGLHHVWRHRDKQDLNANQASIYLRNAAFGTNLLPLAISLSMPLILLSWSLVTFACSVAFYAFQNHRPSISYLLIGSSLVLVFIVVSWTTLYFFKMYSEHDPVIRKFFYRCQEAIVSNN